MWILPGFLALIFLSIFGFACSQDKQEQPNKPQNQGEIVSQLPEFKERRVIFGSGNASKGDGYLAPYALLKDGMVYLYFTKKEGLKLRIFHSRSKDLLSWTNMEEIRTLDGDQIIAYPCVIEKDNQFKMWYSTGNINLAESSDGLNWKTIAKNVLKPTPGSFDQYATIYPRVLLENGIYTMFYSGFDGQDYAILRASSPDGITWTKQPKNPVLKRGNSADYDNRSVAQSFVFKNAQYTMLYGGYDTSLTNPGPYRILKAESADGIIWNKVGVVLDISKPDSIIPDIYSTRDPAILFFKEKYWLFYAGMGKDQIYRIMLASSSHFQASFSLLKNLTWEDRPEIYR